MEDLEGVMSEKKGGVELIERLLNPMWAHSNMPFESPQLEQEENLAAMRDAAKEIQRLLAIPDAAQERIRELEAALKECVEVLALVEHPAIVDPDYGDKVAALGDRIGYGALMSSASASWRERLEADGFTGGEFVAGPCFATVKAALKQARAALSTARPIPEKEESK